MTCVSLTDDISDGVQPDGYNQTIIGFTLP
jgi:hypothetical protein